MMRHIYYTFPIQLIILHIRSNQLLLLLWVLLVLFITGSLGRKLGVFYLFLDPEYLGRVNFWSFFFLGFTMGGFTMTWNLTTYLLTAHYFPFLASLSRPFTKFCINNAIIPLAFLVFYVASVIHFQRYYEALSNGVIVLNCVAIITGFLLLIGLIFSYLYFTNKDIFSFSYRQEPPPDQTNHIAPGRRGVDLDEIKLDEKRWKVRTYLTESLSARTVRSVAHYDSGLLMNIFRQNHLNALIIQIISMLILMGLGQMIDIAWLRIPAAASLLILGSVIVAIVGALIYWFDQWWVTIFIVLLLGVDFLTGFEILYFKNKAYGLNYSVAPAAYSYEGLQAQCEEAQIISDKKATIALLDNWRARATRHKQAKPKLVLLCVSGGGLRAATWSMKVVQTADSLLQGRLLDQTVLITGASGGMIGMAYLRELLLQQRLGANVNLYDRQHLHAISKDMLNSVAFTIVSNDLFLPWGRFRLQEQTYRKDRAYIFEKQLNENTAGMLDKPLSAYQQPEAQALIPMMYITPAIVNDARRLVISPQPVSFMMRPPVGARLPHAVEVDAVDFRQLFQAHGADKLRFLTALRMNATYPYILPNVHLPSNPEIEVMDAGFRDNYGILSATRFVQVFRAWIREHTSGVVLVQISSSERIEKIYPSDRQGALASLINPIGLAGQFLVLQEYEQDTSIGFIFDLLGKDHFEVIRFMYSPSKANKMAASISFHLTKGERENVINAIDLPHNQVALEQLIQALSN